MGWNLVDIGWFCELCYGVVATEGDFKVSLLKEVGDFSYILHIAKNNKFPTTLLHKLKHQIQQRIILATPPTSTKNNTKLGNLYLYLPTYMKKCLKHVEQIISAINHSVASSRFSSLCTSPYI